MATKTHSFLSDSSSDEDLALDRVFLWVKNADAPVLASDGILYPRFVSESAKGKLILASVPNSVILKIQRRELSNVLDADLSSKLMD
jgi:hypothetical protein